MTLNGLLYYLKDPRRWYAFFASRGLLRWMSDKAYLKLAFRMNMNKKLDLENPKTFNEKLQWLKLYDHKPEYTTMVDKYEAKRYIAERVGEEYIIPNYGVWDSFDEIDFDSLPNQFVLKTTHDCGGVVICRDKRELDMDAARRKIEKHMRSDYFQHFREWPYKNVKPRIIAEKYMADESGTQLKDYKIHCFGGKPEFILVCAERYEKDGIKEDFFTPEWEHMDLKRPGTPNAKQVYERPDGLDQMLHIARILSKDMSFIRVDFYSVDHKPYVGELTFFPASGYKGFEPEKYDRIFGDLIKLPKKSAQ